MGFLITVQKTPSQEILNDQIKWCVLEKKMSKTKKSIM